jgi:hypothetical protein
MSHVGSVLCVVKNFSARVSSEEWNIWAITIALSRNHSHPGMGMCMCA